LANNPHVTNNFATAGGGTVVGEIAWFRHLPLKAQEKTDVTLTLHWWE